MSSTKRGHEFEDRGEPSKQVKKEEGAGGPIGQQSPTGTGSDADKAAEAAGKLSALSLCLLYSSF